MMMMMMNVYGNLAAITVMSNDHVGTLSLAQYLVNY